MISKVYSEEFINDTRKKVKEVLPSKRYLHSIGVSYTAASLAMKYKADISKARLAGILHDCAKYIDKSEIADICRQNNLEVREIEEQCPELLHAKLGSLYAKTEYDIQDEDVLNAIKWHTTGHANMSILEKILFVSDYIEPMRYKAKELDEIREEAFTDIDTALIHILKNTLDYVNASSAVVDENTKITYDYYREMNRMKSWKKH